MEKEDGKNHIAQVHCEGNNKENLLIKAGRNGLGDNYDLNSDG